MKLLAALLLAVGARGADPCALITETEVRQIFAIPPTQPLRLLVSDGCSYIWMGLPPSGDQLRQALMEGRGRPQRSNESATVRIENVADASKELDARYQKLTAGYTVERDGEQLTVKPQKLIWVTDLRERAFWNAELQQLVLARKDRLITFGVRRPVLGDKDLMNLALQLAQTALRK